MCQRIFWMQAENCYTSGQLVSLGFNQPDIAKHLWFYIYDEDIYPSRAYSPSIKSPNNVPFGKVLCNLRLIFQDINPKIMEDR